MSPRRAFTLVEILMVTAIVALLSTLSVVGIAALRRRAAELTTADRMQKILFGLQQYAGGGEQAVAALQRDVLGVVPGDFATLADIVNRLDREPGWTPAGLRSSGQGRRVPPNLEYSTRLNNWEGRGHDLRLETRVIYFPMAEGRAGASYFGEQIERTLDIMPPASLRPTRPEQAWYRGAWPTAWPASDWDRDAPGTIAAVLPTPFGQPGWRIDNRDLDCGTGPDGTWGVQTLAVPTGELDATPAPFDLARFDPTRTRALLVASGVLPASDAAAVFAGDRGRNRPWNDAYGNPLVVAAVSFLPPRHEIRDFCRFNIWPDTNRERGKDGVVNNARPRDFLIESARRHFGHWRSVTLSLGALGRHVPEEVRALGRPGAALTWEPAAERAVARAVWKTVAVDCDAAQWDQDAVADPPWRGLRSQPARAGDGRRFLLAPVELRP